MQTIYEIHTGLVDAKGDSGRNWGFKISNTRHNTPTELVNALKTVGKIDKRTPYAVVKIRTGNGQYYPDGVVFRINH